MTRKHFEAIAQTIKAIADAGERQRQAEAMANMCAQQNKRFDRARFFAACGVAA